METVRLLYPDWVVVATICFIIFLVVIACAFIFATIKFIHYTEAISSYEDETIYFIKTIDGDNLINTEEIEQITQRYNNETREYEIIYYLKSGHELKETFENDSSIDCSNRFEDINEILNKS